MLVIFIGVVYKHRKDLKVKKKIVTKYFIAVMTFKLAAFIDIRALQRYQPIQTADESNIDWDSWTINIVLYLTYFQHSFSFGTSNDYLCPYEVKVQL